MSRHSLSRSIIRAAICAALLALPAASAWNLLSALVAPALQVQIGERLAGVTIDLPIVWTWSAFLDGSLKKALSNRVTEALPIRPLLIRADNEIRFALFGDVSPTLFLGLDGQLIERKYFDDYCSRTEGAAAGYATKVAPNLRDIQNYYRARGGVFLYVITPSKAAHLPEFFGNFQPCTSAISARERLIPQYADLLRQAGINVIDLATLIHARKGRYTFDLFPKGGVHWNDVGVAEAVSAIVTEINRQAGRELVPPFTYRFTVSKVGGGIDRDLVELLNVFFPPVNYATPKVAFQPSATCADHPAHLIDAAIVGTSFSHLPTEVLIKQNCLSRMKLYYYMTIGEFGGNPYHQIKRYLDDDDLKRLLDSTILIIEENESYIGRSAYIEKLHAILGL